jgi:hypothetical protein
MKMIGCISCLLYVVALARVRGAEPISIEKFKLLKYHGERQTLIDQAPPEQKQELKNIDLHLALLDVWGSEEGLKKARESQVAKARGFGAMEGLFIAQVQLWGQHVYDTETLTSHRAAGSSPRDREAEVVVLKEKLKNLTEKRLPLVHKMIFNLAPSPAALNLEKQVEGLLSALHDQYHLGRIHPGQTPVVITKEELDQVDKKVDQILAQIEKLPTLTPEQVKKELEDFTDDKVRPWN